MSEKIIVLGTGWAMSEKRFNSSFNELGEILCIEVENEDSKI